MGATREATQRNRPNQTPPDSAEPSVSPTRQPERPFNGDIDRSPGKTTGVHSSHDVAFGQLDNRNRKTPSFARPIRLNPADRNPPGCGLRPLYNSREAGLGGMNSGC